MDNSDATTVGTLEQIQVHNVEVTYTDQNRTRTFLKCTLSSVATITEAVRKQEIPSTTGQRLRRPPNSHCTASRPRQEARLVTTSGCLQVPVYECCMRGRLQPDGSARSTAGLVPAHSITGGKNICKRDCKCDTAQERYSCLLCKAGTEWMRSSAATGGPGKDTLRQHNWFQGAHPELYLLKEKAYNWKLVFSIVCCENQKLLHPSVSCSTERPADTADIREMQDKARGIGNLSAEVQRRFASEKEECTYLSAVETDLLEKASRLEGVGRQRICYYTSYFVSTLHRPPLLEEKFVLQSGICQFRCRGFSSTLLFWVNIHSSSLKGEKQDMRTSKVTRDHNCFLKGEKRDTRTSKEGKARSVLSHVLLDPTLTILSIQNKNNKAKKRLVTHYLLPFTYTLQKQLCEDCCTSGLATSRKERANCLTILDQLGSNKELQGVLGLLTGGPPEAAIQTGYQTTEGSPTITSIATGSLPLPLKVKYDSTITLCLNDVQLFLEATEETCEDYRTAASNFCLGFQFVLPLEYLAASLQMKWKLNSQEVNCLNHGSKLETLLQHLTAAVPEASHSADDCCSPTPAVHEQAATFWVRQTRIPLTFLAEQHHGGHSRVDANPTGKLTSPNTLKQAFKSILL
ncbi:hypothetical protein Anapl_13002 [Anas platyrhynchos]|uniref:Uncharacterized protein n=1 Tax=Anas platyrhynchos TaxID=8839 RepID=R0JQZ3_ANAPL|nr:hypothetical protein Anapl_13002 [Anas platyrhynchos]